MRFTSTRNKNYSVSFAHAVLNCMPEDGGLFIPYETEDLRKWILYTDENTSFTSIAGSLTSAFINEEFSPIICETIATKAFKFSPEFKQLDDKLFMLELHHGPTGKHRDFGISYLVSCLETIQHMRGSTSIFLDVTKGELGSSLALFLRGKKHLKAVLIYPKGTSVCGMEESDFVWNGGNIYPITTDLSEKECHDIVRTLFQDHQFVIEKGITVANTANIGRLLPQAFFYPYAFSRLKSKINGSIYYSLAPGNYSNIVAGLYAWQAALPLNGFITPSTEALLCDAQGKALLLDSIVPRGQREPSDPSESSNIERLEDIFSANSLMMKHFIFPHSISDKDVDDACKELFSKYKVYSDRHTARAYASLLAQIQEKGDDMDACVLIARDSPCLSQEYVQHTLGETPEVPESVQASMKEILLSKPNINNIDEIKKIIIGL